MTTKKRRQQKTAEFTLQLDRTTAVELLTKNIERQACLIIIGGLNMGERIELNNYSPITLGRSPECTILIRDDGISRRHAQIIPDKQGGFSIHDLGSTNGVFVGGKRIQKAELHEGEKVLLGRRTVLKFVYQDKLDLKFQEQMYESSVRDALTGAFNRKHFNERLSSEISFASRHKVPISLLIMDLDHFKNVNDTWGHQVGDQVLTTVSKEMISTLREEDFFARYGGEEFVVIARGINYEGAAALGDRLRQLVENLVINIQDGTRIPVSVSMGCCTIPPHIQGSVEALIKEADMNLYKAKERGRNCVIATEMNLTTP